MGRAVVTRAKKREIADAFKRDPKTPMAELAREFGVNRATVRSVLEGEGLRSLDGKRDEEIVKAYRGGKALPDVAAFFGVHPQVALDVLTKAGVRLRS